MRRDGHLERRNGFGFQFCSKQDFAAGTRFALVVSTSVTALRLSGPKRAAEEKFEVTIPLLPPLLEALQSGPTGDLAFICGERGAPLCQRVHSATYSRERAGQLAFGNPRTGSARSEQPELQITELPWRNWRQSSVGQAGTWLPITPAPPIECDWPERPPASS